MIEKWEDVLNRELTDNERKVIDWLLGLDNYTIDAFDGLFAAFFKAGQDDANFAHEALESGERLD
ncbi:hypothetical protein D3C84_1283860 [compost metagenome]